MTPRHLGTATLAVLRAVADGVAYGFDIIDETGLASGTVYPALASLERRELVESHWEDRDRASSEGRPRRRYYELTPAGAEALEEAVRRLDALGLRRLPESPDTA